MKPLEELYYFVGGDFRHDSSYAKKSSHLEFPLIQRNDNQNLDWYSGKKIYAIKPVDYWASENHDDPIEWYIHSNILSDAFDIIMRDPVRDILWNFRTKKTQFIPSYIKMNNGELNEGWWTLHIWEEWDCWDRQKSEYLIIDEDEEPDELVRIVLDQQKILAVPEQERMIIRLQVFYSNIYLFHENVVNAILDSGHARGVLFLPLAWYNNSFWDEEKYMDDVNARHPW